MRTLVVDETRRTGGVGEGLVAELLDAGYAGRLVRISSKDSFVPLGDAARLVLLSEDEIEAAARQLLEPAPSEPGSPPVAASLVAAVLASGPEQQAESHERSDKPDHRRHDRDSLHTPVLSVSIRRQTGPAV